MVDWIWRLCNMGFESDGVVWSFHCTREKGERNECKNYRGMLGVVGKIYARILLDRVS